jgi:hypothetical protein
MSTASSFSFLLDGYTPSLILATTAVLLVSWQKLSVKLDPMEPPLLKPTIPYIGHIIGIFQHATGFFEKI